MMNNIQAYCMSHMPEKREAGDVATSYWRQKSMGQTYKDHPMPPSHCRFNSYLFATHV